MLKRILRKYWYLIFAWLLAMFGTDFWKFNVMELFASVAIIIGAFFAIRGWYGTRREKERQTDIRKQLGKFIAEGQEIKGKCFNKDAEVPTKEADEWNEKVFNYLDATMGSDYAQRSQSHEGLPIGLTTLSGEKAKIGSFIGSRLARLNQFLAELNQSK